MMRATVGFDRVIRLIVDVHLGNLEGGGLNESPTLWPSVGITKDSAETRTNRCHGQKKGIKRGSGSACSNASGDESRHVQRYVPDDGVVERCL